MAILADLTFSCFSISFVFVLITSRNSSCRKVMFSQACVKNSVHGRGVCIPACNGADNPWADPPNKEDVPPRQTHTPWADTPLGQTPLLGRHPSWADTPLGQTPPGRYSPMRDTVSTSGRYASYWNAYLS